MSSPSQSLRHRGGKKHANGPGVNKDIQSIIQPKLKNQEPANSTSEWDYKLALVALTILAFATRFWKINYPSEVVFDEVHFGKVRITLFYYLRGPSSCRFEELQRAMLS
jgi:dolichyl-phosphate-mannose-protein mannosyltransferase